ncbi:MAG: hypothetical protein FWG46_07495, partial [Treponema sp.]|nr:hypothetical protein [Treponema sp.]
TDPWIYKIDPQGKVVQDWVDKANSYSFFAIDIAVSSGGDVYALGIALGQVIRICKISPDGTADQFWGGQVAEILQYPSSIAVDGAGNVFVLDIDAGTTPKSSLYKITPAGNLDTGWNSGIADYSYDPHCIAAGRDGSVYMAVRVSDAGDFGICKIPSSGEISVEWSIESDISAIAVDGDGNVYAGDNDLSQAKHIRIMRPGSDAAVMARGTTFPEDYFGDYRDGFDYIRSIASYIDGNGKHIVYAVDTASKILKLTEGAR